MIDAKTIYKDLPHRTYGRMGNILDPNFGLDLSDQPKLYLTEKKYSIPIFTTRVNWRW
jgi:hypothetical protein